VKAGRPPRLPDDAVKQLREWVALPLRQRPTRGAMALRLGVSENTVDRAAYGRGYYARVNP
jgi:hypothetical protein